MKKNISVILLFAALYALIASCSKNTVQVAPTIAVDGFAFIKIDHFSPSFRQVVNGKDSFNVYANGTKLNGGFLTYGSFFPSATNLYAAVPAGAQSIRLTVNGVTTPDSITLATFTKTLTAGAYYTFILTDSLLNTNDARQIFVQDNFAITDTSHFTMRFVHAILNDTVGKNVDVYSTRLAANIFANVAPGTVSAFTTQPYNFTADTLIVRRAGVLFELARLATTAVPLARQRAYTLLYKGLPGVTTGSKARSVITYTNQ